ncbi:EcsC family protein [Nocardioides sp.]|uniref:EcsC family protein n=1 Tax=Nocardioides sp. TaxID=35761 RepID=UPI003D11E127
MSPYERRAWHLTMERLHAPPRKALLPKTVRDATSSVTERASSWADEHLPAETVKSIVEGTLKGTLEMTFNPALRSVNAEKVLDAYRRRHPAIETADDLKSLDLKDFEGFRRRRGHYVAASAVQGAGTSLAITGAEVSTTVTGGATAGLIVGAVALDTVASLAMMGRSVGSVAARYGYDVRLPDEELFAMGVLSLGMAGTVAAKYEALSALSRLSQQMMRRATWKQLNEHVLVRVIARTYQVLGLKLTQRKLAQALPFVGVAINTALSANMTRHTYHRAEDAYRLRFLSEKYDVNPREWMAKNAMDDLLATPTHDEEAYDGGMPNVADLLDDELRAIEGPGPESAATDPDPDDPSR